jgi:hypothetical protein
VPAGSWVELHLTVLRAGKRAPDLPPDTDAVDFTARVRGFLVAPARLGEDATVETLVGRQVTGRLEQVGPRNPADFGDPSAELLTVGVDARRRLGAADRDNGRRR